jgi:hypothetical protein
MEMSTNPTCPSGLSVYTSVRPSWVAATISETVVSPNCSGALFR